MLIRPLILAARILDDDYPKDSNPENWRTISGAKVHLNEKGQIDGGAGGKFNEKKFGNNFDVTSDNPHTTFSGKYKAPKKLTKKAVIPEPDAFEVNFAEAQNKTQEINDWMFEQANPYINQMMIKAYHSDMEKGKLGLSETTLAECLKMLQSMDADDIAAMGSPKKYDEAVASVKSELKKYTSAPAVSASTKTPLKEAASVFTEASVQPYNAKDKSYPFRKSNYTKAHQDNAVWCKSMEESQKKFDAQALTVWANAKPEEREAIKEYTQSFSKFNEPLRGIQYGTSEYKGIGQIEFSKVGYQGYKNLEKNEAKNLIKNMTNYIDRSAFDEDIWVQRGCGYGGMDKFLNLSKPMKDYTLDELKAEILGTKVTEHGFMSCGAAKGTGFDYKPVMFNIYAPAGTKMAYAPNFSHYKEENEMILQRGTQFRVAKIEANLKGGFLLTLRSLVIICRKCR